MVYVMIAIAICGCDLGIKYWIEKKRKFSDKSSLLEGNVVIEKSHNAGAFMNFMDKKPNVILGISGVVFGIMLGIFGLLLPKKRKRLLKLALSLLIGGSAGNFFDRLHRGYVVDYLNFPKMKKIKNVDFNISDLFIFAGGFLFLIGSLFSKEK